MQQFDIAIIGGGLVGASLVHALAGAGLSVALIDKAAATELYKPELDNRGLALAYTTKQSLEQLNIWQDLSANAEPIAQVHASEQGGFGFTKLTAKDCNLPALGYLVTASQLGAALMQNLARFEFLTQLRPETIRNAVYDADLVVWTLQLNQQTIQAKLLVAADGTNSIVRRMQNIAVTSKDFAQSAIVCNVNLSAVHASVAYERFINSEVLAMLPFGKQRMKCILTASNKASAQYMAMPTAEFLQYLQQAMGFRLGKMLAVDERKLFPITYSYADKIIGKASVLLGNAANTLHPVAAQGFNLGIRDAMTLAQILHSAKRYGMAINTQDQLQCYADLRTHDHANTRQFSNNLVEIFAHDKSIFKSARRMGLMAAQFIPGIKDQIIAQGLGKWI